VADLEQLDVDQVGGRDRAQLEQLGEHTNRDTNTNRTRQRSDASGDRVQQLVDQVRGQHAGAGQQRQ